MQVFKQQTAHTIGSGSPVVVARPKRYQLAVTFDLPGADYELVEKLHRGHRIHEAWPHGMLCHISGETADGVLVLAIWSDERAEQAYFRDVIVKVITNTMQDPDALRGAHGPVDFHPEARAIDNLIVGPLLSEFQDIGPDLDGEAIHRLGTQPVSLDCTFMQARSDEIRDAERQLGLYRAAPKGLLLLLDEKDEQGRPRQSQIWRSCEEALEFWKQEFLPALVDVGGATTAHPPLPVVRDLKRISVDSSELDKARN